MGSYTTEDSAFKPSGYDTATNAIPIHHSNELLFKSEIGEDNKGGPFDLVEPGKGRDFAESNQY